MSCGIWDVREGVSWSLKGAKEGRKAEIEMESTYTVVVP